MIGAGMSSAAPVIAILDDEPSVCTALGRLLRTNGYPVALFSSGTELLEAQEKHAFRCILLDLHLPGMDGFTTLERLGALPAPPAVIVITGHDQPGNAERVRRLGARAYLTKPVDQVPLLAALREALNNGHPPVTQC
jgi:CheY-like chemotaxis protein